MSGSTETLIKEMLGIDNNHFNNNINNTVLVADTQGDDTHFLGDDHLTRDGICIYIKQHLDKKENTN